MWPTALVSRTLLISAVSSSSSTDCRHLQLVIVKKKYEVGFTNYEVVFLFFFALPVKELSRCEPCCVLEHPGKVLGVFEAQLFGHLVDAQAAENEILGAQCYEIADIVFRTLAKGISDDVAKVSW